MLLRSQRWRGNVIGTTCLRGLSARFHAIQLHHPSHRTKPIYSRGSKLQLQSCCTLIPYVNACFDIPGIQQVNCRERELHSAVLDAAGKQTEAAGAFMDNKQTSRTTVVKERSQHNAIR